MIDLTTERLLTLPQAAAMFPGGVGLATLWRWRKKGVRGKRLETGDSFEVLTTGGGGWGDPLEREASEVLTDYLDQYVSLERGRTDYGVVIDPRSKTVDLAATAKERANRRANRANDQLAAAGK